ncbi:hypothetical protein ED312_19225 [Sinomicrobium pectinilyticum]|uniref:Uncharacterized protein n=1 Tax=Sinomicrobium pectinilyticum TaxID=1084421 RepID=A0A3N0DYC3_SINP1|nr:hypothetical protein ED312_19225 [Sinomicrobium pectinilyticum]
MIKNEIKFAIKTAAKPLLRMDIGIITVTLMSINFGHQYTKLYYRSLFVYPWQTWTCGFQIR